MKVDETVHDVYFDGIAGFRRQIDVDDWKRVLQHRLESEIHQSASLRTRIIVFANGSILELPDNLKSATVVFGLVNRAYETPQNRRIEEHFVFLQMVVCRTNVF